MRCSSGCPDVYYMTGGSRKIGGSWCAHWLNSQNGDQGTSCGPTLRVYFPDEMMLNDCSGQFTSHVLGEDADYLGHDAANLGTRGCQSRNRGCFFGLESVSGVTADFTGDGLPDVFLQRSGRNRGAVLLINDGSGTGTGFISGERQPRAPHPGGIDQSLECVTADFNNDSLLDVICSGHAHISAGGGAFTKSSGGGGHGVSGGSALAVDFNLDGHLDLMTFEHGPNKVHLNNGAAEFTDLLDNSFIAGMSSYPYFGNVASNFGVTADFNGDSLPDFVVFNQFANQLMVFSVCPDGYGRVQGRGTACFTCPSFSIGAGNSDQCEYCPGGRVRPFDRRGVPRSGWRSDQSYICGSCVAGKHRGETQATSSCTDCPFGRYSSNGADDCSTCAGATIVNDQQTGCQQCDPGTSPNEAHTECVSCEAGRFSSFGVQCQACVSPLIVQASASQCNACPAGHGPNEDHDECVSCNGMQYSTTGVCQDCAEPNIVRQFKNMFITPLYRQHASHTLASRAYGPQPHMRS